MQKSLGYQQLKDSLQEIPARFTSMDDDGYPWLSKKTSRQEPVTAEPVAVQEPAKLKERVGVDPHDP